jgi:hypothetical protein
MKNLIASVIAGSLVLAAAFPAAGKAARLVDSNASVRDSANDRVTYIHGARREVEEWRQKLHDSSDSTRVKATEANKAALDDLTRAWTRTEAAARRRTRGRMTGRLPRPRTKRLLGNSFWPGTKYVRQDDRLCG